MRQYQEGDDLRRIHWPSVAHTGELMIRQDESSRRSSGLVFLDSRESALGQIHGPAFERAVSVAASLGVLLARGGFSLRLSTAESSPADQPARAISASTRVSNGMSSRLRVHSSPAITASPSRSSTAWRLPEVSMTRIGI